MERLGTRYGGWNIPANMLNKESVVYSAGVGEDISFDLLISHTYNPHIFLLDPTPRAIRHVREVVQGESFTGDIQSDYLGIIQSLTPNFSNIHLKKVGLWDTKGTLQFYKQINAQYVSQSLVPSMYGKEYDIVEVDTLDNIMKEHGHTHIDLLKLDIEGAECKVLENMMDTGILPTILCVEFDLLLKGKDAGETAHAITRLQANGYKMIHTEMGNVTFLRESRD